MHRTCARISCEIRFLVSLGFLCLRTGALADIVHRPISLSRYHCTFLQRTRATARSTTDQNPNARCTTTRLGSRYAAPTLRQLRTRLTPFSQRPPPRPLHTRRSRTAPSPSPGILAHTIARARALPSSRHAYYIPRGRANARPTRAPGCPNGDDSGSGADSADGLAPPASAHGSRQPRARSSAAGRTGHARRHSPRAAPRLVPGCTTPRPACAVCVGRILRQPWARGLGTPPERHGVGVLACDRERSTVRRGCRANAGLASVRYVWPSPCGRRRADAERRLSSCSPLRSVRVARRSRRTADVACSSGGGAGRAYRRGTTRVHLATRRTFIRCMWCVCTVSQKPLFSVLLSSAPDPSASRVSTVS